VSEPDLDESFVLWIDRDRSQGGQLIGRVEQTRRSLRVRFATTGELVRFLTLGIREPVADAESGRIDDPPERS